MERIFKAILTLLSLLLVASCAQVPSGSYIKLSRDVTLDRLSSELGVPKSTIETANKGRRIATGSWVFIPMSSGVMGQLSESSLGPLFDNGELLWPVPSSKQLSSKFGKRWGRKHEGIDIPARVGASILASDDGVIVYSGRGIGGYGNLTVISHSGGLFTVYAHAKKNYTRKGEKVFRGQVIAEVGLTGRTTGPHLHFEVRYDSEALDPLKYISKN